MKFFLIFLALFFHNGEGKTTTPDVKDLAKEVGQYLNSKKYLKALAENAKPIWAEWPYGSDRTTSLKDKIEEVKEYLNSKGQDRGETINIQPKVLYQSYAKYAQKLERSDKEDGHKKFVEIAKIALILKQIEDNAAAASIQEGGNVEDAHEILVKIAKVPGVLQLIQDSIQEGNTIEDAHEKLVKIAKVPGVLQLIKDNIQDIQDASLLDQTLERKNVKELYDQVWKEVRIPETLKKIEANKKWHQGSNRQRTTPRPFQGMRGTPRPFQGMRG